MRKVSQPDLSPTLDELLRNLHLPSIRSSYRETARMATAEGLSFEQFLWNVCHQELVDRFNHRNERLIRESRLPLEKTWESFDQHRLTLTLRQQIAALKDGSFLDRRENVLAFGNPGSGKTHLLCALCQQLVYTGRRILYRPCSLLIQDLLVAKRDLALGKFIKHLSMYEAILIDDIGYVQQSRDEMEVLFTLLAERYERGSVLLTSNLAFSGWEAIFKDPMTTAAAIDRLVHHSVILELHLPSYRMAAAKVKAASQAGAPSSCNRVQPPDSDSCPKAASTIKDAGRGAANETAQRSQDAANANAEEV